MLSEICSEDEETWKRKHSWLQSPDYHRIWEVDHWMEVAFLQSQPLGRSSSRMEASSRPPRTTKQYLSLANVHTPSTPPHTNRNPTTHKQKPHPNPPHHARTAGKDMYYLTSASMISQVILVVANVEVYTHTSQNQELNWNAKSVYKRISGILARKQTRP